MTLTINDLLQFKEELLRVVMDVTANNLRVAIPGIIQSFDATEQTVTVQPAIKERIRDPKTLEPYWEQLPLLVDVPISVPRAGGFSMTLPIQQGDECLVVFGDMSIDGWWNNGGIQTQPDLLRHALSNAFAIVGIWNQQRLLPNYSTTSAQLRTDDGSTYIDLKPGTINLVATNVQKNGVNI